MPLLLPPSAGGGPELICTPWGRAADWRPRRMRPGRSSVPEERKRSQRDRIFGALVAVSSEKGYRATTVADIVQLAGVSGATFYKQFRNRQECLLAALDALVEPTIKAAERGAEAAPAGEARLRLAVASFLGLLAEQPAASMLVFIEAYAAGAKGEAEIDRALQVFESFAISQLGQIPERKGMPSQIVRALLGGIQKLIQERLNHDEAEALPDLAEKIADWILSIPPPPGPLVGQRRRGRKPRPFEERLAVAHPPERLMRALAALVSEKGYQATTVADVAKRGAASQRLFYEHFESKEVAFLSALDSGASKMLAAALPGFRRAGTWPESVRAAYEAMFAFGIEEPEYAWLVAVEMYAVGQRALQTRDTVMEGLEARLVPEAELKSDVPPIAAEAMSGALYALIREQVKRTGAEAMPDLAPTATYMTLAPFLGAEQAYEQATEGSEKW